MRWVYLLIIIVFALATLIFAVQNLDTVTVSFLSMKSLRRSHFWCSSSTSWVQ